MTEQKLNALKKRMMFEMPQSFGHAEFDKGYVETLIRAMIYVNAFETPKDSVDDLKDSIGILMHEALSQMDGNEGMGIVGAYTASRLVLSLLD